VTDLAFSNRRQEIRGLAAKEQRRRHAISLLQSGWSQAKVARHFGVSREAVRKWYNAWRRGGSDGLTARPPRGAPPKCDRGRLSTLGELLKQGPASYGLEGPIWTPTRIAELIAREYGVRYRPTYMRRLLARLRIEWPGEPVRREPARETRETELRLSA
jgi:transposase